MPERDQWVTRVNERLQNFLEQRASDMFALGHDVSSFDIFARQFLTGGKRFRALCAIYGFRTHDEHITENAIDIAAALEVFHAAALVHDDIMDSSDTRRGNPSAHRAFEHLHSQAGWSGDGASFGVNAALLFGDLLLAYCDELIAHALTSLDARTRERTRREFDRMRREVTLGQYLDVVEERAWPTVSITDALDRASRVVVFKSAKYSIEAPLVIGAALAGASDDDLDALRAFGLPLGVAFQLRDDILGVFGDPEVTGKPAGDDIREGKRTVLIAVAMERLDSETSGTLNQLLGDRNLSPEQIESVRSTLVECGAHDEVEKFITEYVSQALTALDESSASSDTITSLRDLALGVTNRVS